MNPQESPGDRAVSGLSAGRTMKEHNLLMARPVLSPETDLAFGNINNSSVYDDLKKFDRIYCFWRSAARPGRQPGQAHHKGPRQAHPGAGDEHFQKNMRKWCRRMHLESWKSLLNLPAGSTPAHDCKRTQGWLMKALR
jgi:hypothetical protein